MDKATDSPAEVQLVVWWPEDGDPTAPEFQFALPPEADATEGIRQAIRYLASIGRWDDGETETDTELNDHLNQLTARDFAEDGWHVEPIGLGAPERKGN